MKEEEEEKKTFVEKDTATKVEFVKVDIRTPRRRKSQLIQNGKVKFTKLDEEEGWEEVEYDLSFFIKKMKISKYMRE